MATKKDHTKQEYKGLYSTKEKIVKQNIAKDIGLEPPTLLHYKDDLDNIFPESYKENTQKNEALYFLTSTDKLDKAYLDLTGRFPVQ